MDPKILSTSIMVTGSQWFINRPDNALEKKSYNLDLGFSEKSLLVSLLVRTLLVQDSNPCFVFFSGAEVLVTLYSMGNQFEGVGQHFLKNNGIKFAQKIFFPLM